MFADVIGTYKAQAGPRNTHITKIAGRKHEFMPKNARNYFPDTFIKDTGPASQADYNQALMQRNESYDQVSENLRKVPLPNRLQR
jgi:hypothetical protein